MSTQRAGMAGRWASLCLALVVVLATVNAGRVYLWCVPMAQPMDHCCPDEEETPGEHDAAPTVEAPKSELRALGALPAARDTTPVELAAPAVAIVAEATLSAASARAPLPLNARIAAPAPRPIAIGPPSATARCASLQVYRC